MKLNWIKWVIITPILATTAFITCERWVFYDALDNVSGLNRFKDSVEVWKTGDGFILERQTWYREDYPTVGKALDKVRSLGRWRHEKNFAVINDFPREEFESPTDASDVIQLHEWTLNETYVIEIRHISALEFYARVLKGQEDQKGDLWNLTRQYYRN